MAIPQPDRLKYPALLSLAAAAMLSTQADAASPQIVVRFEVTSAVIRDGLRSQREAFEKAVAEHLAAEIGARYRFVAWSAVEDPAAPVLGRLIARLADDSSDEMPPIVVQWFSQRADEPETRMLALPIEIYKKNDPNVDATDRQGLLDHTLATLDTVVPTDAFMSNLFRNFVARIPLAKSVKPIPAKRVVELPLAGEELPIGQRSVMEVEFSKSAPDGTQKGMIALTRFTSTGSGRLHGGVERASVNQEPLALTDNWNPRLPTLLQGTSVQCFLVSYEPDRSVEDVVKVPQ